MQTRSPYGRSPSLAWVDWLEWVLVWSLRLPYVRLLSKKSSCPFASFRGSLTDMAQYRLLHSPSRTWTSTSNTLCSVLTVLLDIHITYIILRILIKLLRIPLPFLHYSFFFYDSTIWKIIRRRIKNVFFILEIPTGQEEDEETKAKAVLTSQAENILRDSTRWNPPFGVFFPAFSFLGAEVLYTFDLFNFLSFYFWKIRRGVRIKNKREICSYLSYSTKYRWLQAMIYLKWILTMHSGPDLKSLLIKPRLMDLF